MWRIWHRPDLRITLLPVPETKETPVLYRANRSACDPQNSHRGGQTVKPGDTIYAMRHDNDSTAYKVRVNFIEETFVQGNYQTVRLNGEPFHTVEGSYPGTFPVDEYTFTTINPNTNT